MKFALPIHPKEAVSTILKSLSNKRFRDVVERRFGIRGTAMTLDAIGKSYGITRERVRQIENDALKHLRKPDVSAYLSVVFSGMNVHMANCGGVASYDKFVDSLGDTGEAPHVELLAALHPEIKRSAENDFYHARFYIEKDKCANAEKIMHDVVEKLSSRQVPVSWNELTDLVSEAHFAVYGSKPSVEVVQSYVGFSKLIGKNSYEEYGLLRWPTIKPKNIRDKAYVVLLKSGKPMHFSEVAGAIDQSGFCGKKHAHPQTVHNELIKDASRFVLVGRGLYALRDWGYEPGTVKDVIMGVLKNNGQPMDKDMLVKAVMERRFVKENTIMLNLQNKEFFKKGDKGEYYLA